MTSMDPLLSRSLRTFEMLKPRLERLGLPLWLRAPDSASSREFLPSAWQASIAKTEVAGLLGTLEKSTTSVAGNATEHVGNGVWLIRVDGKIANRSGTFATALVSEENCQECPASVRQFADVFRWMIQDVMAADADRETISQFSDRLAQSYEEVSLLFRVAKRLNATDEPAELIKGVLAEVRAILPFTWIAIRFDDHSGVCESLRGHTYCDEDDSSTPIPTTVTDELLAKTRADRSTKIIEREAASSQPELGTEVVCKSIEDEDKLVAVLVAGGKAGSDSKVTSFELQFLDAAAEFLSIFHQNTNRFAQQQSLFVGTVRALAASIDAKDSYTRGHSERVAHLTMLMATKLGLSNREIEQYRIAGLVHDVGKIGVPEAVLCKTGKLTPAEFAQTKLHPEIGHSILNGIPAMEKVLPGVLHHHERWAGGGYPHGISGTAIPLVARVIALADTFDAMSSTRSYRAAMSRDAVLKEIRNCSGTQFDPELVEPFLSLDFTSYDRLLYSERSDRLAA